MIIFSKLDMLYFIIIDYLWCFIDYFNCGINIWWRTPRTQWRTGSSIKTKCFFEFGGSSLQVLTFWVRGEVRPPLVRELSKRVQTTPDQPFGSPISVSVWGSTKCCWCFQLGRVFLTC